ncbi:MAG: alanine--tRNA ligase [Candidatus Pacearchaeota archaeon]
MNRKELIDKYLKFFESKEHKVIPSSSLIPENDPTVLFTTAGMHPLVPYLLGQNHPLGKRLVNVQKCIRTGDIDEIGDSTHHTFFEMLGNWSLGDYWKEEAIKMTFEFHRNVLKIPLERYAVTVFNGNKDVKKDVESVKIWLDVGIPKERIASLKDNWWGPAGSTGPCGPDTEMFYWAPNDIPAPKKYNPKDERWVEIGNDVLLEYVKNKEGKYESAKQKNIDFGGGVERSLAALNGFDDNYLTEIWKPIIEKIEKISRKKYKENKKTMRIIADHLKASVFIIADGVVPSNTDRGYVLRRLIRRAVRFGREIKIKNFAKDVAEPVFKIYEKDYLELKENKKSALQEIEKEEKRFLETIEKGMRIFKKLTENKESLSGKEAFLLYQSYGFPLEMIIEETKIRKIKFKEEDFEEENKKHQDLSRTASKGKFAAGLADHSEMSTKYHTATHMLHKALKQVLGEEVRQMGSNITPERLRFDFSFDRKLTDDEKERIEQIINNQIKKKLPVRYEEMPYSKAIKTGVLSYFRERYPEVVKVYSIGDFSREICTGPHVENTKDMGIFKITKEESSSSGVRRIKAVLE